MQKLRVELYCDRCENGVQAERTVGFGVDDEAGKRREYKIEIVQHAPEGVCHRYRALAELCAT